MDTTLREFYLREIASLEAEIRRIKAAQRLMRQAARAVRIGTLNELYTLGFGDGHVRELLARHKAGKQIFPAYSSRENRLMLGRMQMELISLKKFVR